ncbi:Na/Pi cotransporter family protein [Hathewaya histolytica]|uniref:Na/Pi-cotransporter family protein/PhoU family protein n=1 Tax=Hathewaya histolytica TaxID=1498 RepID=A0A4U9RRJ2_HATHI|nr:Na/Pi cotransporter family protein [Hathewaya histolytica]VTQ94902.1 Na/Pi-cotransporter family protein/PhoU family protein [Hathewaya histolytica]
MSQGFKMAIELFGGLGLFLYGMKLMGDGLQNATGEKLKSIFEKITSNPIKGVVTGALVTAIIQSSSATTVMVVGFVNAQLMNLYQATAVIMGANIGTTITAQIVTLDIEAFIPIFIGVGTLIVLFTEASKGRELGNIVLGFGILFLGMNLMKTSMEPLQQSELFREILVKLDGNVFLGILAGLAITAIIQSSSATTGILISLAGTGVLKITMVIPILFGCNIGTCVTALLSSIGTSKTAKKAAVIHLLFNLLGTIIFIPLFKPLAWAVTSLPFIGSSVVKNQIANAHTIFNIANTLILLPFIKYLVKLANTLIKGEDETEKYGTQYIDDRLLETPVIAVGQTVKEISRMANKARKNLEIAMEAFEKNDEKLIKKVYKNEKLINLLEDEIVNFLVKLSKEDLADHETDIVTSMFHVVNDIERIGDHAENIADLAGEKMLKRLKFSNDANSELMDMFQYTIDVLTVSVEAFEEKNIMKAEKVKQIEERIDSLEKELRSTHIKRLNQGLCNASVGTVFLDLISNLERIGDHANNISDTVINITTS